MDASTKPPWANFSWKTSARWTPTFNVSEADTGLYAPAALCEAKNRIGICPQHIWEYAKKISNPYELVYTYKSDYIPQSVAVVKPLSRSYFKMMELLNLTGFMEARKPGPALRTAHVCEGPGGFIEAIYDYAGRLYRSATSIKSSHAMSLRSTKPHIPGWRRAQQFMNRHREVHIEYGADNTGNVLNPENRASFIEAIRKGYAGNPIHIFTADGGFDFTANYLAQESTIFPLLLASVHTGFSCLAREGMFILKIFDCFSPATKQLIAWMAAAFDKWNLYKPATSRPCNSEQYFVGLGFRGTRAQDLAAIEETISRGYLPKSLFDEPIPQSLMMEIEKQAEFMLKNQLQFLELALERTTNWSNVAPSEATLHELWVQSLAASRSFVAHFSIIHKYPWPPISCRLSLPPADSVSDYGEDTSQPDVFQQSSTPDDDLSCPVPSGPS
jgi:23S rRNA U2552 (ribose-2'-O)-methylase RlmE/FtsJ